MNRDPETGIEYDVLRNFAEHSGWFLPMSELMHRQWPWLKPDANPFPEFQFLRFRR